MASLNHEEHVKEKAEKVRRYVRVKNNPTFFSEREERTRRVEINKSRKQQVLDEQIQETKEREQRLREFQQQQHSITPSRVRNLRSRAILNQATPSQSRVIVATPLSTRVMVETPGRQAIPPKKTKHDDADAFPSQSSAVAPANLQNEERKQPKQTAPKQAPKNSAAAKRQDEIRREVEAERLRQEQERIRREQEELERARLEFEQREETRRLEEQQRREIEEAERQVQEMQEESMIVESNERTEATADNHADVESDEDLAEGVQELSLIDEDERYGIFMLVLHQL